jgi:cystathionine gamma-synthase
MSITRALNELHNNENSTIGDSKFLSKVGSHLVPSINFSSANSFQSIDKLENYFSDKYNSLRYNRDSKEIIHQIENYFKFFFKKQYCLVVDSGMRAISIAINSLLETTNKIFIPKESYRKTREYCEYLVKIGAITKLVVYDNSSLYLQSVDEKSLVIVESFSNPHLIVVDFEKIKRYKSGSGCKILLDSTFSGLINHKVDLGFVDIEVQSLTKYVSGYNDIVAGVINTNEKRIFENCWDIRSREGGILDSMSGYLLIRSLRSYDLRLEKQRKNTLHVYKYLINNPQVIEVFFPGKQVNENQNQLFNKYYLNGGSVISFVSKMEVKGLSGRMKQFKSIKIAPSFGSVDSLIEIPSIMSHFEKNDDEIESIGLERNLVRLSVGCEPFKMIVKDLNKLLKYE